MLVWQRKLLVDKHAMIILVKFIFCGKVEMGEHLLHLYGYINTWREQINLPTFTLLALVFWCRLLKYRNKLWSLNYDRQDRNQECPF